MDELRAELNLEVREYFYNSIYSLDTYIEANRLIYNDFRIVDFFVSSDDFNFLYSVLNGSNDSIKTFSQFEYGDFQTNDKLASEIVDSLRKNGVYPKFLLEPTCGKGNFIMAAIKKFFSLEVIVGIDINATYIWILKIRLLNYYISNNIEVKPKIFLYNTSVFNFDFKHLVSKIDKSQLLIIGNPPWVTTSALGVISSDNMPIKHNINNLSGLDALTGKSNFDISEYISSVMFNVFGDCEGYFAFIIKSSVVKNIVFHQKLKQYHISDIKQYDINAKTEFGVAVSCALMVCKLGTEASLICSNYKFSCENIISEFGWNNGNFFSNLDLNEDVNIDGYSQFVWRQGLKHDCAKAMELSVVSNKIYKNKNEILVELEKEIIFPLLKSSDLKKIIVHGINRRVIVTQRYVGENTDYIKKLPLTYDYLLKNIELFDKRKSTIYNNKPKFSIFGVGDYSFMPYKVAVSGLYKTFHFTLVLPYDNKPVMLDDTCYYISFNNLEDAIIVWALLNSTIVEKFLRKIVFPNSKRMITKEILMRIDLLKTAKYVSYEMVSEIIEKGGGFSITKSQWLSFIKKIDNNSSKQQLLFA